MSLNKICQVCKKLEFILYKLNDEHYCPLCAKLSKNITNLCVDATYLYCFCGGCKIVYRYNKTKKHHTLHKYGNFYYAEIIERYTINNITTNNMPTFLSELNFTSVLENPHNKLCWKSFEKTDYCCVCFEETTHTTECGHFLCETCIPSLTDNICPICRKKLEYIQPNSTPNPILYDDDDDNI